MGVILYELLSGQLPFLATSQAELLNQILLKTPPQPSTVRPHVPQELDAICLKAISKRVEDRYADMQELDRAISDWEADASYSENAPPNPLRSTIIAPPSQGEASRFPTGNPRKSPSFPHGARSATETVIRKSPLRQRLSRITAYRPSTEQRLWMATFAVLLLCGILLASHRGTGKEAPPLKENIASTGTPPVETPVPGGGGNSLDPTKDKGQEPPVLPPPDPKPPGPRVFQTPDFRAEFPETVGGWTRLSGTLWHYGLPKEQTISFTIELRSVFSQIIDGHEYQDVEIEVTTKDLDRKTADFCEQASLRIDVDHYKQFREIKIREGHVRAGETYVVDP